MPSIHDVLEQQGNRLASSGQGTVYHFGRFGDEQSLAGLQPVAQLDFREIHISRHTLVVDGVKMNEPHCPYSANLSSDTRKPLVSKGFIPVSGAGLEPARLYKIGTSTSS